MKNSLVIFFFSVLDLFLQVLSKNSIWHFDIIWLISQQFTRRDLTPVAFLVYLFIFDLLYRNFYDFTLYLAEAKTLVIFLESFI